MCNKIPAIFSGSPGGSKEKVGGSLLGLGGGGVERRPHFKERGDSDPAWSRGQGR